jgi:ribosome-binding protein aMBF1 (putative translation factor)
MPRMDIRQNIDRIRAFRQVMGWSLSRLAREAGLRESSIRSIDTADWNPESKTIARLEGVIPTDWKIGDAKPAEPVPAEGEAA